MRIEEIIFSHFSGDDVILSETKNEGWSIMIRSGIKLKDDDIKRFITRLIKFRQILFSSVQKSPKLIKDISLARNRFASFKLKYLNAMMNE
jgi:hypothetical protein